MGSFLLPFYTFIDVKYYYDFLKCNRYMYIFPLRQATKCGRRTVKLGCSCYLNPFIRINVLALGICRFVLCLCEKTMEVLTKRFPAEDKDGEA